LSNGASNDTACNFYGGLGEVERSVGKAFASINAGFPNEKYADVVAANGYTRRLALSRYCSHVISEYGINDCSAGTAAATTLANMATFAAMFGGKPFIQTTISPRSTSTDAWATTANQTTVSAANTPRVAFNNAIRGGMAVLSGYIEVADQVESA
jgi:hypothetical protein